MSQKIEKGQLCVCHHQASPTILADGKSIQYTGSVLQQIGGQAHRGRPTASSVCLHGSKARDGVMLWKPHKQQSWLSQSSLYGPDFAF